MTWHFLKTLQEKYMDFMYPLISDCDDTEAKPSVTYREKTNDEKRWMMLVFHPKDRTTAMLSALYEGVENAKVIDIVLPNKHIEHLTSSMRHPNQGQPFYPKKLIRLVGHFRLVP